MNLFSVTILRHSLDFLQHLAPEFWSLTSRAAPSRDWLDHGLGIPREQVAASLAFSPTTTDNMDSGVGPVGSTSSLHILWLCSRARCHTPLIPAFLFARWSEQPCRPLGLLEGYLSQSRYRSYSSSCPEVSEDELYLSLISGEKIRLSR